MSSRKRLVASAIGPWLAAFVAAAPFAAAADLTQIKARGTLRVLAAADEDPVWFSIRAGASPGFEREVLEGFARLHKLRFEAVPVVRWEDAIPMLLRQDGDVLGGMSVTPERRQRVDFSVELLPARSIVVTRRPGDRARTLAELRAARVVIVPNTTWAEALEKAGVPVSRALRVADISAAVEAIQTGHADATVTGVVDFLLQRRKHRDLEAGLALLFGAQDEGGAEALRVLALDETGAGLEVAGQIRVRLRHGRNPARGATADGGAAGRQDESRLQAP
jgi:ABC-type amino acid transport substrate-binding protein